MQCIARELSINSNSFLSLLYPIVARWDIDGTVGSPRGVQGIGSSRKFQRWTVVFQNLLPGSHDSHLCISTANSRYYFWKTRLFSSFLC